RLGQFAVVERGEGGAQGVELGAQRTSLADGCVGVVAGDGRLDGLAVVGARPQPEVGASVGHVDADGAAGGEEFVDGADHALGGADVVVLAPVVEPAAPQLGAHQRAGGVTQLFGQ